MFDKQVYELTINDLACYGVWFFPMDDTVEDELTVRPLLDMECCTDFQLIVRASFEGDGYRYSGYLYWDGSGKVEYLKPVVLLEDGTAVSFWAGIAKPSWEEYPEKAKELRSALPLSYVSDSLPGLPGISGVLEGLGYIDGDTVCWVR
ncbi:hypothetical protein NOX82_29605 [Pseudomonas citronellolis]|uniref:hypothetical protein n=1 Tax=Pseudomonas citronellolis TaxID=53408 RepID=UPI00211233AE|nr:hypothetical protein [Pseudomonas citronellolis]UUC49975.1 hypothetical protein NOX82_29605 [Pseudomonas citronellolis]